MSLQIGYARVDITPEAPVPLAGLGNTLNRISDNTLDRLQSTCLACTGSNGETLLLYTSDLIRGIPEILDRARNVIFAKHGIAPEKIMFSNTHTHSATDYFQDEHEGVKQAIEMLIEKFSEAAGLALADRVPAKISAGDSHPQTLNFVRHYTKDPETKELIGHPYEPDNQLQLMKITREGAKDIVIMNWQAHPCFTSGYNKHDISADYIHTLREVVEQETGMLFAFFLGASGDVNARSRIKSEVIAPDRETYGELMRKYIQEALENQKPLEGENVQLLKKELTLEIDHSDDGRIGDAQIVVDFWKETYDRKATDAMAKQYGINSPYHANAIIGRSKQPESTIMPVNVAVIGGLGFAFAPYEMFCKNGMFIKENSPCGATVVATCSNAGFSYLADDYAFTEQCYEVDVRRFPRGTAEKLASKFVSMLEELQMGKSINPTSLDTISGALSYAMGIEPPKFAAAPNAQVVQYIDNVLRGKKADRILMYNPDAVAQWVYEKHPYFTKEAVAMTDLEVPLCAVYPPVTPVCFGTMYTGAQPEVHGIQKYEKPVLKIDTLFDALIRAGKKPLIIASQNCSIAKIFLQRDMDYIITGSMEQTNAAAVQAILEDKHDFILVYNGNYDARMHRLGPEAPETLAELRTNSCTFAMLSELVKTHWKQHNTLVGFAMDHGCHWVKPFVTASGKLTCGSHGEYISEDMNIVHRFKIYPATE